MAATWGDAGFDDEKQKSRYVPPHLRGRGEARAPPPAGVNVRGGGMPTSMPRQWGSSGRGSYGDRDSHYGRGGPRGGGRYGRGGGGGGGYRGGGGSYESRRPTADDPFKNMSGGKEVSDHSSTAIDFGAYEDIPVETSGRDVPPPIDGFEERTLGAVLMQNVRKCGFTKPTPVQRYAIPIGMATRDLMACAQTGSGKTAAFCFPIIADVLRRGFAPCGRGRKAYPLALVLAPTRELTCQIFDEARKFTYQTGIRPVVIYGGAPVAQQVCRALWSSTGNDVCVFSFGNWNGAAISWLQHLVA